MSRAFVKEPDGSEPVDDLTERPISEDRNLVTPNGLKLINAEISRLAAALHAATMAEDQLAIAMAKRDLRYWTARQASAELVPVAHDASVVRFGLAVTLEYVEGEQKTFRIVGLDEADAARGLLSYTAPLAKALLGKQVGDSVTIASQEANVIAVAV